MNKERIFDLYETAYGLLDDLTPIPADCGKLCGAGCCKGGRDDGMLLFPFEEEFLQQAKFLKIKQLPWRDGTACFAVCRGRCKRQWRPLSCRIYPYAPKTVQKEDKTLSFHIQKDPRAAYSCPLLCGGAEQYIDEEFKNAVVKAFGVLSLIPGFSDFMVKYDQMLEDYARFAG